ncbi:hypothetical protein [Tetragenococcus koreensis]|nr:hypothetical protein [Tetragenococcus koreensis]MCF1584511.1 hypothetical protein [Tetragenococcus koreensis]MCF1616570.1 hypothetical protein [Tetragenococcus koreensis]MCF1621526.1 hypothetical protein [Tetragenococcus koreensis]MCF1626829.1 hypothetical protein [Tetragenococcus koreensis]MCF1677616.1 hypothetical protein [Tetragenococcus koreensis]
MNKGMTIMEGIDQIKRRNVRFPVFSDETGVKLQTEKKHPPYSNDENWILTEENDAPLTKRVLKENKKKRGLRRSKKVSQEKTGLTIPEQNELKEHRKHLPDYSTDRDTGGKKLSLSDTRKYTAAKVKRPAEPLKGDKARRSYFAPKYVPASMNADEKEKKNSERELLRSLKKPSDDYLMFDTDFASSQEEKDNGLRIHKFDREDLSEGNQERTKKRKQGILNRSLKGMIEEDTNDLEENGYFREED